MSYDFAREKWECRDQVESDYWDAKDRLPDPEELEDDQPEQDEE